MDEAEIAEYTDELVADAERTAEEYREEGWEAILVRPDDINILVHDAFGIEVTTTDEIFDEVESLAERLTFDATRVYRADEEAVRFLVVGIEATAESTVVLVPAFFATEVTDAVDETAREQDAAYTHVRPEAEDRRVTFSHDDPELFF